MRHLEEPEHKQALLECSGFQVQSIELKPRTKAASCIVSESNQLVGNEGNPLKVKFTRFSQSLVHQPLDPQGTYTCIECQQSHLSPPPPYSH